MRAPRPRPSSGPPRSPRRTAAVSAVLVAVGLGLTACGDDEPEQEPTSQESPTETPSESPSPDETEESASPSDSPTVADPPVTSLVYFIVDGPQGIRLAREPHELPAEGTAEAAVAALFEAPDDPDYGTTWNPDSDVLGIEEKGGVVTVDLNEAARTTDAGPDVAQWMQQQLVYTVTEVLGEDLWVVVTIEGRPAGELWGSTTWDEPVDRAAPMEVRNLVQIDTPGEGGTSGRKLTVTGEAAAFEATVPWRVVDGTGAVVRKGFATAEEGQTLSPYSFTVKLAPGTYTVEVSEDDASGGEGAPPRTDTRTVTIG